jgi:transposase
MRKIKIQLSPKPSKTEKEKRGKTGFVPVAARWIIERSNAWMERCKILVKNYEKTLKNANTKIQLCFLRIALKSLHN